MNDVKQGNPVPRSANGFAGRHRLALPELIRTAQLVGIVMGLAFVAPALAAASISEDDRDRVVRLAEYEGLLGQALPLEQSLCIDDVLRARWPTGADPPAAQWDQMLEQVIGAREQCASAGGATERAAAAIRRGMALQVERQRMLEERRARLRACTTSSNMSDPAPGCKTDDIVKIVTPSQWSRVVRATLLGQRQ